MGHTRKPIDDLKDAIEDLPEPTRRAMLEGVRANRIVVGAYSSRDGAVCPMLAAHRRGERTSVTTFARAWDQFSGARRARRATRREVRTLVALLEASLTDGEVRDLAGAVRDHQALARARRAGEATYICPSDGRMNWISGMTQAGESRSSSRTASPMSDGVIISSAGT